MKIAFALPLSKLRAQSLLYDLRHVQCVTEWISKLQASSHTVPRLRQFHFSVCILNGSRVEHEIESVPNTKVSEKSCDDALEMSTKTSSDTEKLFKLFFAVVGRFFCIFFSQLSISSSVRCSISWGLSFLSGHVTRWKFLINRLSSSSNELSTSHSSFNIIIFLFLLFTSSQVLGTSPSNLFSIIYSSQRCSNLHRQSGSVRRLMFALLWLFNRRFVSFSSL